MKYETASTELSAALRAVGVDLIEKDPIVRVFTEERPANPEVSHGLARGGQCRYRHHLHSSEFSNSASDLAQAFATPGKYLDREKGWQSIPENQTFDFQVNALREKLKGTEAGGMLERIFTEYPREIMRYIRAAMDARKDNISEIAKNPSITELVCIKTEGGGTIVHHISIPPEKLQALLDA